MCVCVCLCVCKCYQEGVLFQVAIRIVYTVSKQIIKYRDNVWLESDASVLNKELKVVVSRKRGMKQTELSYRFHSNSCIHTHSDIDAENFQSLHSALMLAEVLGLECMSLLCFTHLNSLRMGSSLSTTTFRCSVWSIPVLVIASVRCRRVQAHTHTHTHTQLFLVQKMLLLGTLSDT